MLMRDVNFSYLGRQPSPAVVQCGTGHAPCKTGLSLSHRRWDRLWMWLCGPELSISDQWEGEMQVGSWEGPQGSGSSSR